MQKTTFLKIYRKDTFKLRSLLIIEMSFVTEKLDATPERSLNMNGDAVQVEAGEQKTG